MRQAAGSRPLKGPVFAFLKDTIFNFSPDRFETSRYEKLSENK